MYAVTYELKVEILELISFAHELELFGDLPLMIKHKQLEDIITQRAMQTYMRIAVILDDLGLDFILVGGEYYQYLRASLMYNIKYHNSMNIKQSLKYLAKLETMIPYSYH